MSNHHGVRATVRLVEELRDAALEFIEGADRLGETTRLWRSREEARAQAARTAALERSTADRHEAEEAQRESLARAGGRHQSRLNRIKDAEKAARKHALERLEAEEGRRKFELQRDMLRATREMEAGLAAAETSRKVRDARLAELETSMTGIWQEVRSTLSVYGDGFVRRLESSLGEDMASSDSEPGPETESDWPGRIEKELAGIEEARVRWKSRLMPRLQSFWPIWLILVLAPVPLVPVLEELRPAGWGVAQAGVLSLGLGILGLFLFWMGRRGSRPSAGELFRSLGRVRWLHHTAVGASQDTHRREREALEDAHAATTRRCTAAWNQVEEDLEEGRRVQPAKIAAKAQRAVARWEAQCARTRHGIDREWHLRLEDIESTMQRCLEEQRRDAEAKRSKDVAELDVQESQRTAAWDAKVTPLLATLAEMQADPSARVPSWEEGAGWEDWNPPDAFSGALRFGWLDIDLARALGKAVEAVRGVPRMPARWRMPLLLTYPAEGSILFETRDSGREEALSALNQIVFRLLSSVPAGRADLTIIDPVGLGQSFAGLMHLADDAEHLLHGRIWTQGSQIETQLGDLCDHLEKVIQMYLRDEFATIAEYNEKAGSIAEKYRFLVVADFPEGFTDLALRRLRQVAANGARCGVYFLVHWDLRSTASGEVPASEMRSTAARFTPRDQGWRVNDLDVPGVKAGLEVPPGGDSAIAFIQRVARLSRDSSRVEVPFEQVAPDPSERWTVETTTEMRVPIGRTGATKLQYLALGEGTRQHALIAGKTGSGKSTLFHVIITNLGLWCPPEEVEFYLVDFKKGVEFKCYATHRLPHARVVAIESDREFGLSVLERIDDELRRRGELFRERGVQDLAGYRRSGGAKVLPRVLLAIDEFQEFFVEEDRLAQNASVLLDRIVRQGRAFGVHVVLGSQTLGGAYTVARTTMGQMVVRIALQCNEADAYLIMDENNPAPRLLSRPGEGIYNDAAGVREANSPFQTVWLPDTTRDKALRDIRAKADEDAGRYAGPVVFEGNSPADVRGNPLLQELLMTDAAVPPPSGRVWLGAPNSIKGPTEVVFDGRSGSHLLLVGQREDASLAAMVLGMVTLGLQHPAGTARFFVLDGETAAGSGSREALEQVVSKLPHPVTLGRAGDAPKIMGALTEESESRGAVGEGVTRDRIYLLILGLQGLRSLRVEDDFSFGTGDGSSASPGAQFRQLLVDGPGRGIHVAVSCDTYNAVMRFLGRKALSEFGTRVLFQMSANDSASLVDSPAASRLGLHRALLFQEREAQVEVFRPYAMPDAEWMEEATRALQRRATVGAV